MKNSYRSIKLLGAPLLVAIAISLVWGGVAYAGGRSSRVENAVNSLDDRNTDIMPVPASSGAGAANNNSLLSDADAINGKIYDMNRDAMAASQGIAYSAQSTRLTLHEPGKGGPTSGGAPKTKTIDSSNVERIPGDVKIVDTIDDSNGKIIFKFDNGDSYVLIIENWQEIKSEANADATNLAAQFMFDDNLHTIWEGTFTSSKETYINSVRNDKVNELWYSYAESRGLGHMDSWQRPIFDPNDGVTWIGYETISYWYGPSPTVTEDFDPFTAADTFISENESTIGMAADIFASGEGKKAVQSYVNGNAQSYGWNDWTSTVFAGAFAASYSSERASLDTTDPFDAGAAMDRIIDDTTTQATDAFAKEKAAEATAASDNPYYTKWYEVKLAEFNASGAAENLTAAQASYDNAQDEADAYARQFGLPGSEAYSKAESDYNANVLAPLKAELDAAQSDMDTAAQGAEQAAIAAADAAVIGFYLEPSTDYLNAESELRAAKEARDKIEADASAYASQFASADDMTARDEAFQRYKDENGFDAAQERVGNAEEAIAPLRQEYERDFAAEKADAWQKEYDYQKMSQDMNSIYYLTPRFTSAQNAYDAALADEDVAVAAATNDLMSNYGNAYDEFLKPLKDMLDSAQHVYDEGLSNVGNNAKAAAWNDAYNEFYQSFYDTAEGYYSYTLKGETTNDNWLDYIGIVSSTGGFGDLVAKFANGTEDKLAQLEAAHSAELDAIAKGRAIDAANKAYADALDEASRQREGFAGQYINDAYATYVDRLVTDALSQQKNAEISTSLPQIIDEVNARNVIEVPTAQDMIFSQSLPDVYLVWQMMLAIGPETAEASGMEDIETSPYDIYEISDLELPDGGLAFAMQPGDEEFLASSGTGDEISKMIGMMEGPEGAFMASGMGKSDTLATLIEKFKEETNPQKKEFLEMAIWALANMDRPEGGTDDSELEKLNEQIINVIIAVENLSDIMKKGELGRLTDIFSEMSAAKDGIVLTYREAVGGYYLDLAGEIAKNAEAMKTRKFLSEKLTEEAILKLSPREIDAIIAKLKASEKKSMAEEGLLKLESQLRVRHEIELKKKAFELEMKRLLQKYLLEITSLLYNMESAGNIPDKAGSKKPADPMAALLSQR